MWIFARRHDCPHTPQELLVHPAGAQQAFTVVGADGGLDVELALEPNANPAGRTFQTALFEQNIPATAFEVDDIQSEYRRLKGLGSMHQNPSETPLGMRVRMILSSKARE
ncbi:MAG TPA: VOC family protein [Steroidobacteraceae bacterium]|nr:VOC family protein [Steroidobacteraceae bacterium]